MTIECVLFDYSGTLTTGLHLPTDDVPYDPDAVFVEMAKALSGRDEHAWHRLERGEITLADYIEGAEAVVAGVGVLFDVESPLNVMANLVLLEDRISLARELRDQGVRVGVVTNNVVEWEPLWRPRLPGEVFETIIDSAQVGTRKPESAIYELALDELAIDEPASVAFVDDFEWNVAGAEAVGMRGVHCHPHADLRAELLPLLLDRST